jgi:hypothetical protein
MSDYVTLMGAEQVANAGYQMRDAASNMNSAASTIGHALERHQWFLDDWLMRFERALEAHAEAIKDANDLSKFVVSNTKPVTGP